MSKTLHLYVSESNLAHARGSAGLLCELAPDSPVLQGVEERYTAEEMLGSPDEALKVAYGLVSKMLANTPSIDGFPPLCIFDETLLEQVSYIVQTVHLDRWIASHGFSHCEFLSHSPWLERLREVRTFSHSTYALLVTIPIWQTSPTRRAVGRLWNSRPTPTEFFRRVTPLYSRCFSAMPLRSRADSAPQGGIWFYSTAYNYTKIGLEYEAYLPARMNYLVEDPATGGRRLQELGREWHLLYEWSRASDIPSKSEALAAGHKISRAVADLSLADEEKVLREVLLRSEWWHLFLTRRLPFALFNSRALGRWRKKVAPEMIVVGNAGWERALLLRESPERIPVVMLQHGIMHWVYAVADQPVDVFLLRGPFFRRCINENLRRKTVIQNFSDQASPASPASQKKPRTDILFITTPYDVPVLFHLEDRRDILRSLLRVSHGSGHRLLIRVHPLEKVSAYERAVYELERELEFRADVDYSQGPGVDEVLAGTCVAVLHFSTMFLDCLRHGVPIISFGWHWFPNKRRFEEERIFTFASDLKHFEELLRRGIAGSLPQRRAGLEDFLAPAQPENISSLFNAVWDARKVVGPRFLNSLTKDTSVQDTARNAQ